jgi:hypothetical protein
MLEDYENKLKPHVDKAAQAMESYCEALEAVALEVKNADDESVEFAGRMMNRICSKMVERIDKL